MKYPVLKTRSLPNLFKHCSHVLALHIEFTNTGIQEDTAFVNAYLDYTRKQIYASIEANFVSSLASRVQSFDDMFVVFKTNTTKKILFDFITALFAELDIYCDQQLTISYQYLDALIYQEGAAVRLFKTNKIGDDIKESIAYQKMTHVYEHDKKPRGKQLYSIEEYRRHYTALSTTAKVPTTLRTPTAKPASINQSCEDACEYYI